MEVKNKTSSFKMVNRVLTHSLHGNYFKTTRRMQNKFTNSPENEKVAKKSEGNGREKIPKKVPASTSSYYRWTACSLLIIQSNRNS